MAAIFRCGPFSRGEAVPGAELPAAFQPRRDRAVRRGIELAVAAVLLALVPTSPAPPARAADTRPAAIEGVWHVVIHQDRGRCTWRGTIALAETGERIAGEGGAKPPRHLRRCRALNGAVEGRVEGRRVRFGFATGPLGAADFEGTLGEGRRTMAGTWSARRAAGRWRAERVR